MERLTDKEKLLTPDLIAVDIWKDDYYDTEISYGVDVAKETARIFNKAHKKEINKLFDELEKKFSGIGRMDETSKYYKFKFKYIT